MNKLVPIFILAILLTSTVLAQNAFAASKAQKAVDKAINKAIKGDWKSVCQALIKLTTNKTKLATVKDCVVTPPNPNPDPICKDNEHLENHKCVPNPEPNNGVPEKTGNITRLAVVGDVDNNGGLTKQLDLAVSYGVDIFVLPGDFEYHDGKAVLAEIEKHGFTSSNSVIAVGNHDNCSDIASFGLECTGVITIGDTSYFLLNGSDKMSCSGADSLGNALKASPSKYKFIVIHEPFATVSSNHPPNGAFDCFNTVIKGNADGVLQAHNHNYQRFMIDGVLYGVFGTGTHDTGSSMYKIGSNSFNGNSCLKCFTGTNGITLLDLAKNGHSINGYFVSNSNEVKDTFEIN